MKYNFKMTAKLIIAITGFGLLFQFAPVWLRGAVLGFFLAMIMNMFEGRAATINYYEERLRRLSDGKG